MSSTHILRALIMMYGRLTSRGWHSDEYLKDTFAFNLGKGSLTRVIEYSKEFRHAFAEHVKNVKDC